MKLSKMRAKARAAFNNPRARVPVIDPKDPHGVPVPTVFIRGRGFTRPQAARQHDG